MGKGQATGFGTRNLASCIARTTLLRGDPRRMAHPTTAYPAAPVPAAAPATGPAAPPTHPAPGPYPAHAHSPAAPIIPAPIPAAGPAAPTPAAAPIPAAAAALAAAPVAAAAPAAPIPAAPVPAAAPAVPTPAAAVPAAPVPATAPAAPIPAAAIPAAPVPAAAPAAPIPAAAAAAPAALIPAAAPAAPVAPAAGPGLPPAPAQHQYYATATVDQMHAALTQQNTTLAQAGISQLQYDVTKDAAYYAITMKMHKTPPGLRFLACSHACPVTAISDVVTASLRTLADAFRDMWRDRIGTDPWFCLHSGAVMDSVYAFNAQQLPRSSVTAPQAFDFARLYTNIPHAELADTMASLITATLAHAQRVAIAVTVTPPKTPDGRRKYEATLLTSDAAHNAPAYRRDPMTDVAVHTFTRDQFLVLFRSLVCSTFIRFGTFALVRQTCGIPMGISAAPFIANLFLAWFKYRFLTQPAATAQRQRVLHAFDLTKRYLDDLLALNNPFITRLLSVDQRYAGLHGLYPASLQVEAQSHPHLQAQLAAGTAAMPFLDILLILRTTPAGHARITTRLYDKRVQPVFDGVRLSRFIGTDSNVNEASKRNIFTGQFHRLRRVVTEVENFAFETANLITALTRMGYRRPRLLGDLQRMLQRTPEAYYVQRRQRHRPEYADLVGLTRQYLAGRRHFDSTASPVELTQSHYW